MVMRVPALVMKTVILLATAALILTALVQILLPVGRLTFMHSI